MNAPAQTMHTTIANSSVLPAWLVIPLAAVVMLTVAAAIIAAAKHTTPSSRRRIRVANGWVMLLITPLAATGFGLIDSSTQPRLFIKIWILIIGLIGISIVLAFLDMVNTARLAQLAHRRLLLTVRTPTPSRTNNNLAQPAEPQSLQFASDEDRNEGGRDD